jgi:preprotein translocase subunit SecG
MLLEAFSKSPIMGCFFQSDSYGNGYNEKGFHVYWMNKLTVTGIVGFVFFLSIIIVFVYRERKNIEGGYSYYYLLAIFSVLLYGVFKNIGGREIWYFFFVIILGMYYLPLLKKKNNMIEDNVLNQ